MTDLDAAWVRYAERIKAAGESITGPDFPADPRLRAEGYRYVSRLANLAHQIYLEFGSTTRPSLFRYNDDISTFGAPNTDNNYCRAMVDPAGTYRVAGDIAGLKELIVSVHDGEMALGNVAILAEVTLGDLEIGGDGRLELYVGGPGRSKNWIPLPPEAAYLNVRQFVADWEHGAIATLHIERLDDVGPPENVTPEFIAAALDRAATWVETSVAFWNQFSGALKSSTPTNEFSAPRYAQGGAVNMVHGGTRWELDEKQALVVEFDQPQATYWSIQTYMFHWLAPLDFRNRVTSLNDTQVHVDDDGRVRVVISHQDPGVQNWLDVSGLREGLCSYRWVRATTQPTPVATLVDVADVRKHLPPSTPEFSADQRKQQMTARQRGFDRRFRR